MSDKAGAGTAASLEWDAYVQEVRDAVAGREAEYIEPLAQGWTACGRGQFKCLSPLRSEKTASFYVYVGKGCNDFGTAQGGDLIWFVREFRRCNFREAVDELAQWAGLPTWDDRKKGRGAPAADPEELLRRWHEPFPEERVFAALTYIVNECFALLPTMGREHLVDHYGYPDWFIERERVGYCPHDLWEILHAGECPFTDPELLATGFFHRKGNGDVVPTFGGRLVFPYWRDGVVRYAIGREFFGRAKRGDVEPAYYEARPYDSGKYKKLPTHSDKFPWVSGYVQNEVLWGEDCLRGIRDEPLHITEGVTDAGTLALLGFRVISPVTITFRDQDADRVIALIKRHRVRRVVILNDNDTTPDKLHPGKERHPGLEGAKKMALALWRAGIAVHVGRLPRPEGVTKIDVNEIGAKALREGGEERARAVLKEISDAAPPYLEFLASEIPADAGNEAMAKHMEEIGTLAERMTTAARLDLVQRILDAHPRIHKRNARKAFDQAVARETVRRQAVENAEAAAAPAPAEGGAPAPEGGAAASPAEAAASGRGSAKLGAVLENPDGFYERRVNEEYREPISTFSMQLVQRVIPPGGGAELLAVRVVARSPGKHARPPVLVERWVIPTRAWNGKRAFIGSLPHAGMSWTGNDDEVQALHSLLYLDAGRVPTVQSTNVLGRHVAADGTPRFVLPAGVLSTAGWMAEPDLVLQLDGGSNLSHRLPPERQALDDPDTLALAKEALEALLHLHEPEIMATLGSWMMASLFGPCIRAELGCFPILNVVGSPGSGKSSLLGRILWPMFAGVQRGELLSCTSSAFSFTKDMSAANALAVILDELKESDMGAKAVELLYRLARRVYSGDTETRGRADQDVNLYFLIACLCIAGETRLEHDQAIAERCVLAQMDGTWIREHPEGRARFDALAAKPLWRVAVVLQAWSLRADVPAMLARARLMLGEALAKLGRGVLPERVRKNLLLVAFGAVALNDVATALGTDVGDVSFAAVVNKILRDTFDEDDASGPATRVRSNLDEAVIEAGTMAVLGVIQEGKHYAWVDQKLRLWLAGIEAAREEWRRGRGLPSHSPGVRALLRIAREAMASPDSYVTALEVRTQLGDDRRPRCLEIDPEKIPASLGVESFPATTNRTWGGARTPTMEDWRRGREPN